MPTANRIFIVMELLLVLIVAGMLTMGLQPLWRGLGEGSAVKGRHSIASSMVPDGKGFRARTGLLFLVSPHHH